MSTYITEGPLHPIKHKNLLVQRDELNKILKHIDVKDSYIALGNPRQTGKTTILNQVVILLRNKGYAVANIDLEKYAIYKTPDFYKNLSQEIIRSVNVPSVNYECNNVINQTSFLVFLKHVAGLLNTSRKFIVILDEVGGVPEAESQSFFSSLRWIFTQGRSVDLDNELYNKVLIIFSGSLDLYKLSSGKNSPLYNICTPISLADFSLTQVYYLVEKMGTTKTGGEKLSKVVFFWTDGHPYLTQKLLDHIEEQELWRNAEAKNLNKIIEKVIDNEFLFGNDNNTLHLTQTITKNADYQKSIFRILRSEKQKPGELGGELIKLGILKRTPDANYVSRNRIYQKVLEHFLDETSGDE